MDYKIIAGGWDYIYQWQKISLEIVFSGLSQWGIICFYIPLKQFLKIEYRENKIMASVNFWSWLGPKHMRSFRAFKN